MTSLLPWCPLVWFEDLVTYWYETIPDLPPRLLLLITVNLHTPCPTFSLVPLTYYQYLRVWKYEQLSILTYSLQHANNNTKFTHIRIGIKNPFKLKTRCKLLQRVSLIGIKTFLTAFGFQNSSYCHVLQMFLFLVKKKVQSSLSRHTLDTINN